MDQVIDKGDSTKRERKHTPKMEAYMQEESEKRLAALHKAYEQWKAQIRDCKQKLKQNNATEDELGTMMDSVKDCENKVLESFERYKYCGTPDPSIVRRVDACIAVTTETVRLINEIVAGVEQYNDEDFKQILKETGYANSIFTESTVVSGRSTKSVKSVASERAVEAVVELAETRAQLAALEVDRKLSHQSEDRELINAKRDVAAAEARFATYTRVAESQDEPAKDEHTNISQSTAELAKALADSVNLNRLPIPEPAIFSGDPIDFIEWRTAFKLLIEGKNIDERDKIYYLRRYVAGEAKQAISGFFYSGSVKAYDNAMGILEERFGHPFIVQRAFRNKLDNWPNIPPRNPKFLRDYADFLQACNETNEQLCNLDMLSDCEQNRKMMKKLPEWAAIKWNREVQLNLDNTGRYPSFKQFVNFVSKEARIACNPVSSPYLFETKTVDKHSAKIFSTSTEEETKVQHCSYCKKGNHSIDNCYTFASLNIEGKRTFVKNNNLCFGCLSEGHRNRNCPQKLTCARCNLRHPTCMHEKQSPGTDEINRSENLQSVMTLTINRNESQSTSMIVPVWLSTESAPDREILTYALLDTQSDTSFIHEETAATLQVQGNPINLSLSTMTSERTIVPSKSVTGLMIRGFQSDERLKLDKAYTREFIPVDRSNIPTQEKAMMWPHLGGVAGNVAPLQSCDVGLLIGYNCPQALAPIEAVHGEETQPYAVRTRLGWSIVGYAKDFAGSTHGLTCHRVQTKELPLITPRDAIKVLEGDFANDSPHDIKVSQDDVTFLKIMKDSIYQRDDRHLEMPLPFKERPELPNNKGMALLRLNHLKRKLSRDQVYHEQYKKYMNELIERGDAELAPEQTSSTSQWYIPHHGVFHPKKPGKLRVVFDCSAKYSNTSLNEHLLNGPDLTNMLTGVLVRFRRFPVAIMCDIEKMFHQFFVNEPDRDYLRFVWWEDGNLNSEPKEYRMRKHLFGAASSPACANYGLKHLAKCHEEVYPEAAAFVQNDFYVDDGLASVQHDTDAVNLVKDAQSICRNGGIHLHKFVSNSRSVIETIPASERAEDVKDLDLGRDDLPIERALGMLWNVEQDMFQVQTQRPVPIEAQHIGVAPTRRNMLSIIASIFDPLGLLSPVVLTGKKILQHMCQHGVGWDDELSNEDKPEWSNWISNLSSLNNVQISRCLIPNEFCEDGTEIELHHFSDASSYGYGQCSYIRLVKGDSVHCALLIGKARVAPVAVVTIPRLELTAAMLSVKMSEFLKRELNLEVRREYFWTDSKVVLGYIANEARRFHTFVANRVQVIRQSTEPTQWFYVRSKENPADHASRGLGASELHDSTWFTGPTFLWQKHIEPEVVTAELQLGDPEVRTARTLHTGTSEHTSLLLLILERFSSWSMAVSVVARLQRLANGIKGIYPPTVEERRRAELTIIKELQRYVFHDTIDTLRSSGKLPSSNSLYPLDPMLQDGVMCVGTRLQNANLPESNIYPIILPRSSHVSKLIISHAHKNVQHQGRGFTLNKLRCLGYWLIGGSKAVAKFIRDCVICRKLRRPTECQKMADLPPDRVEECPPFTYCGMDCFGPITVKQGRKEIKRYGLLFTCLYSRAIHIEMLDDMSTDAFINGLRCFMAIRGSVRHLRSDQGSNFIGAKNEFSGRISESQVVSYCAEKQCDFIFNAPSSSHTGGVWERQIRTIRNIMNAVLLLCPGRLDDSSLRTLFYEVMLIINSRPLTVSDISDPSAPEPLTPNHILTGKSDVPPPPPGHFVREDLFTRKRWRRVQYLCEQFWTRWQREYLNSIALRQKWHTVHRNIQVNDIVLVKDEGQPRNHWPLAVVVEANPDKDGLVRRVRVKVGIRGTAPKTTLERSVHKLVLLIECQ